MRSTTKARLAAISTLLLVATVCAVPAHAQPLDKGTEHEQFIDNGLTDYCHLDGYPELTVNRVADFTWSYALNSHGPDGLAYSWEKTNFSTTRTNPANGRVLTTVGQTIVKDYRVFDNGDGTLTIDTVFDLSEHHYDADGQLLASDSVSERHRSVIDDNGTPQDPFDDGDQLDFAITKAVGNPLPGEWCAFVHAALA